MNCEEFWLNVLSNSIATVIAGTILGFIGGLIISTVSWNKEKKDKARIREHSEAQKKLTFLETIKDEVVSIIVGINVNASKYEKMTTLPYVRYDISYWEIIKTSGEIPSLFTPNTLQSITLFYSRIAKCNLLFEQLLMLENSPHISNINRIFTEFQKEINAIRYMIQTTDIEKIITDEINTSKNVIATLEKKEKGS